MMTLLPIAIRTYSIGLVPSCVYILCSFVSNAVQAITGFGSAMLFILFYTLCDVGGVLHLTTAAGTAACHPSEFMCSMKYAVFLQAVSLIGAAPYLVYTAMRSSTTGEEKRTSLIIIPARLSMRSSCISSSTTGEEQEDAVLTQKLLLAVIPATLVATPCGQWLQDKVPCSWIRILLGSVIIFIISLQLLIQYWPDRRNMKKKNPEEEQLLLLHKNSTNDVQRQLQLQLQNEQQQRQQFFASKSTLLVWGTGIGVSGGFLGGLIGMWGPPVMIFFLQYPCFSKTTIRAVGAVFLLVDMLLRMIFYSVSDIRFYTHYDYDDDDSPHPWFVWSSSTSSSSSSAWWLYGGVMVAGMIGVPIGDAIHQYIDPQKFQDLLGLLLAVTGIVNIIKGLAEVINLS